MVSRHFSILDHHISINAAWMSPLEFPHFPGRWITFNPVSKTALTCGGRLTKSASAVRIASPPCWEKAVIQCASSDPLAPTSITELTSQSPPFSPISLMAATIFGDTCSSALIFNLLMRLQILRLLRHSFVRCQTTKQHVRIHHALLPPCIDLKGPSLESLSP